MSVIGKQHHGGKGCRFFSAELYLEERPCWVCSLFVISLIPNGADIIPVAAVV